MNSPPQTFQDLLPETVSDVSEFPNLSQELARRGWSDDQLRLLLGENLLRVMAASEAVAAGLAE